MAEKQRCLETGHCAIHGEEVERRKEVREDLVRLETQMDGKFTEIWAYCTKNFGLASNFRSQAKVVGIIAGLIWFGSFAYTRNAMNEFHLFENEIRTEVTREADKLHRLVNKNENDIDQLETGALLTNQRLSNIENSTNRIERRLSQLVDILADSGEITKREKSRWDFEIPDTNANKKFNGEYKHGY